MVVTRDPGEVFLLRNGMGPDVPCSVERIDPDTLATVADSRPLAGGPMWPGGLAAHANGSLYVVFGNHAHRLGPDLAVLASRRAPPAPAVQQLRHPPRRHPGDQGLRRVAARGARSPPTSGSRASWSPSSPTGLAVVDRMRTARALHRPLSSDGDHVYVVGDTSLLRVGWDGRFLPDPGSGATYLTAEGQTYGWDCVLALGAAWFLDDGDGIDQLRRVVPGQGDLDGAPAADPGRPGRRLGVADRRVRAPPAGSSPTRRSSTTARGSPSATTAATG